MLKIMNVCDWHLKYQTSQEKNMWNQANIYVSYENHMGMSANILISSQM